MFPTLAAQEDRMWWWRGVCIVGIILSAYVLGRDVLRAYQEGVATTHMIELPARVNNLEVACQRDYPRRTIVTKAQARVIVTQRERERDGTP
jgi:hypothetical protein